MLNNAWYDMVESAVVRLEDAVTDVYESDEVIRFDDIYDRIFQHGFNTDYEYIYTNECKEVCNKLDVWDAIALVCNYEVSSFGECYTELTDPLKVANMVWYIVGYLVQSEIPYIKVYTREELVEVIKAIKVDAVIYKIEDYINRY